MKEITKQDIKKIEEGCHETLMETIEYLIDVYSNSGNDYNDGYDACVEDMALTSHHLADHIVKNTTIGDDDAVKSNFTPCAVNGVTLVLSKSE